MMGSLALPTSFVVILKYSRVEEGGQEGDMVEEMHSLLPGQEGGMGEEMQRELQEQEGEMVELKG